MMDYFKQGKEFARAFVWHKFTNSWATILGGLATVSTPMVIAFADMHWAVHILILIPLSVVASSFYWYKIAHADEYAKEGAEIFQEYYKEQKINQAKESLLDLKLHGQIDKNLRKQLIQNYNSFVKAIDRQEIISSMLKESMLERAEEAMLSGAKIFIEIKDLIATVDGYDLVQLEGEYSRAEGSQKLLAQNKLEIYQENRALIELQRESIEELVSAFELSKLNLAQATSSFDEVEKSRESLNSLVMAVESAKAVQQRRGEGDYGRYL